MAASVGGKGVALISTCEAADTILRQSAQGIQDGNIYRPQLTGRPSKKWQHRSIGSRNILLILTWSFIVNCSQRVLETRESKIKSPWLVQFNDYIYLAAFAISCPIASLLAEVVIGRYKFISLLLRALWLLHITGVGISLSGYCLQIDSATSYMIGYYLVAVPASGLQRAFLFHRERDEITTPQTRITRMKVQKANKHSYQSTRKCVTDCMILFKFKLYTACKL